jgi:hypothetical protein
MVVRRYFYVDIDPIARQVATSKMMELIAKFRQQFPTTTWKASFTFLPFDIQLIQKKHTELLGPVDLIISSKECQGFSVTGFGEGLSDTRSGLFMNMVRLITWVQSIFPTLSYVIENTFSQLDQREKVQEHYMLVKHYLGKLRFLCTPVLQLVDQLCTTFSSAVGFEIHYQRPQPVGFSHIG